MRENGCHRYPFLFSHTSLISFRNDSFTSAIHFFFLNIRDTYNPKALTKYLSVDREICEGICNEGGYVW